MSELVDCTLGDLIDKNIAELQTGPFGTMLNASEYTTEGTPVIAVQDIGENMLVHEKFVYVDDETAARLNRYRVREGDIIFGRKGAVERRALIKDTEEGWIQGSDCIRLRLTEEMDPRFISYQFGSSRYRAWMIQNATGATMPSLSQAVLKALPMTIPPFEAQRAIADVLTSLDDKIDLLHRQNKTLEAMAETLFRQWFIEEASDEWKTTTFADHFDAFRGLSYKGSGLTTIGLGLPMHNLNSVFEGGGYKEAGIKYYSGDHKDRHVVHSGDVIVTNTEQGHEFRLIGCPAVVPRHFGDTGIFSQHIYRVVPKETSYLSRDFLYYLILEHDVREQIISATNGSTVNMLAIDGLQRPTFKLPPEAIVLNFTQFATESRQKRETNHVAVCTLEKIRDTLLPKLISGEVRVLS